MITSLKIQNYAIIRKVEIEFDDRLNIITGETGAGKSIILGALQLIMGQRADSSSLFKKDEKCIVEAVFKNYPEEINAVLSEYEFDLDSELIIRREIAASGKSRAFVNDSPAKLKQLQTLSALLVDLNSQFEVTSIQQKKFQLALIDALADNTERFLEYKKGYKELLSLIHERETLQSLEGQQLKEYDYLKFQLNEIEEAQLTDDEQESLESEQSLLEKSEDLIHLMQETSFALSDGENAIIDRLRDILNKWNSYADLREDLQEGVQKLTDISELLEDFNRGIADIQSQLDTDPGRLDEVSSRLNVIYNLLRKHQVQDTAALLSIKEDMHQKLQAFDNKTERIKTIDKDIEALRKNLLSKAHQMSTVRNAVFKKLEDEINAKLTQLAMATAEIKVMNELSEDLNPDGIDHIEIHFKANKGAEFLPIRKVASGGESARLMLALKSTVAEAMSLPTMIFDEIDAGVSGEVAQRMGAILMDLSQHHQLICITHSPQVASRAVKHFFVYKTDNQDFTETLVKVIEGEQRVDEIAKMLSGDPPTEFAILNARELLEEQ